MRCRRDGMDDPVCSLGGLLHIGRLEWDSNLGSMMNEASQPYQLIDHTVHQSHFNLNVLKLSAKFSMIFFQLNESVNNVRSRASVRELDFKRGGLVGNEVAKRPLCVVVVDLQRLWRFDDVDVVQSIAKDIKSHYLEPCTSWTNAPDEHKEFWWRALKVEHLNHKVYKEWKSTASKRLRDMVWKAMDEEITEWMPSELKKRVQALRETDAFKKRGKNKKGTVYGLGMESEAYHPRSGHRSSPSSSYTPSVVS
ncbi:hypothetical protein Cgig2_023972 [Carnegiea gigantea]|uniref:Uncharacterized protein n=1 Tax=Carnegiea gigantea TaxID=171969 RepID=A0A9Q1KC89_9CARY|nr:hypothetical protein Cgig2_023972 [Carnegiea gigantea]